MFIPKEANFQSWGPEPNDYNILFSIKPVITYGKSKVSFSFSFFNSIIGIIVDGNRTGVPTKDGVLLTLSPPPFTLASTLISGIICCRSWGRTWLHQWQLHNLQQHGTLSNINKKTTRYNKSDVQYCCTDGYTKSDQPSHLFNCQFMSLHTPKS